jgi:hypothetical protein
MKRQAVAAEYNSGRDNMAAWYREVGISEQVGRELLNECRQVHLVGSVDAVNVSQALPTSKAAREYAKAEPEVKEIIKEIIREDPEAEIKAAEIKKLREQVAALNEQPPAVVFTRCAHYRSHSSPICTVQINALRGI